MFQEANKHNQKHLFNLIRARNNSTPNFSLFIGAGASISSGVKRISDMIAEWRQQLYEQSGDKGAIKDWLKKQTWYKSEDEYQVLFEKVYDTPSQRRIYIEKCVKDAKPSWGYIYLSSIISNNFFNIIFTPNFDDLLNEACFVYADLKPIVCAHDSAVAGIRITSIRPKIIKLHGDFLYDNIKNTKEETQVLEQNMSDKLKQFSREYGLVVVGYGGRDRSIMEILEEMVQSKGFFPNGLYWCIRKGSKPSKRLQGLLRTEKTYLVEIEGFDEFMAEMHHKLKLELPDSVRDPYRCVAKKLDSLMLARERITNTIVEKDIGELEDKLRAFERDAKKGVSKVTPNSFLGMRAIGREEYIEAAKHLEKAYSKAPLDADILYFLVIAYIGLRRFPIALKSSLDYINWNPSVCWGYIANALVLSLQEKHDEAIEVLNDGEANVKNVDGITHILSSRSNEFCWIGSWKQALEDSRRASGLDPSAVPPLLNKAYALKMEGKTDESLLIAKNLLARFEVSDSAYRPCAHALLGEKEKMIAALKKILKNSPYFRWNIISDVCFSEFREDDEFRKIVYLNKL